MIFIVHLSFIISNRMLSEGILSLEFLEEFSNHRIEGYFTIVRLEILMIIVTHVSHQILEKFRRCLGSAVHMEAHFGACSFMRIVAVCCVGRIREMWRLISFYFSDVSQVYVAIVI